MRDIKFRAWDSVANRFTQNLVINYDGTLKAKRFDGSLTRADKAERFDIQMFTGLKDKNGKEIYEGDIVQATDERFPAFEVKYQSEWASYILQGGDDIFFIAKDGKWQYQDEPLRLEQREFEVIGNIYENPELLNKNKDSHES